MTSAIAMVWTESPLAQNATRDLDQVQLEPGPICGAMTRRPIGEDLAQCQRFAYRAQQPRLMGVIQGGTNATRCGGAHPVRMRATPTVIMSGALPVYDGAGTATAAAIGAN